MWLALQNVTDAATHPELHYFDESKLDLSLGPDRLFEKHVQTAVAVCDSLEPIVADLLRSGGRGVIEGAWITPEFASRPRYDEVNPGGAVRSAFVHEPDQDQVLKAMVARRGLLKPTSLQLVFSRVCWLHGNWVADEAERLGLPVVSARPPGDLVRRILGAVAM